jgi:hypothetical protein
VKPEAAVKRDVRKILDARQKSHGDVWYYMPVQNGMGVTGIPDFICCIGGLFLAIETKAPGKLSTVTANQQRHIDGIRKASGSALVLCDTGPLVDVLVEIDHALSAVSSLLPDTSK